MAPHEHVQGPFLNNRIRGGSQWHPAFVQPGAANTRAGEISTDEAKCFQSEYRSMPILLRVGCQSSVNQIQLFQTEDDLTLRATPDHIFTENTVEEVAVRRAPGWQ